MFHLPHHRDNIAFREAYSDASALHKNISNLSGHMKHSQMGRSAEDMASVQKKDGLTQVRKDRLLNFKKSHMSYSTGDLHLNNRPNLSLFGDFQLNDSQFFEVMYVGKIRVSHRKLPKTFIDDAIPKFIAHDKMKMKSVEVIEKQQSANTQQTTELRVDSQTEEESDSSSMKSGDSKTNNDETPPKRPVIQRLDSLRADEIPKRNRSASFSTIEQNRTMVYILGRTDLRLISPDRKQVLLHKNFADVMMVVQGVNNADHFGIICNEIKDNRQEFIGYVFKCQSGSIAHDVVTSMTKSLETLEQDRVKKEAEESAEEMRKSVALQCDHCPLVWYSKLSNSIHGLSEKKVYGVIMKHIEELSTEDYEILMEKFFASDKVNDYSQAERNKFLMALIEAHCQLRQQRHVHDTIENRSEFLHHYLGGSTILMKAKRSLTSSFDQLLKRRGSKDLVSEEKSHEEEPRRFKPMRSMSLSSNVTPFVSEAAEKQQQLLNTSKMDMFIKVGNTSKERNNHSVSWRQNILKTVILTEKEDNDKPCLDDDSLKFLSNRSKRRQRAPRKRNAEELRALWKFAGKQIIVLLRMEKENARLQEQQNEHEIRRMKLDYDEIVTCEQKLIDVWEKFIYQASRADFDSRVCLQAMKQGVPRSIRGSVWTMLAKQQQKSHPETNFSEFPNFDVPYGELLKNLTDQQHAIFLDIGRTFPNHEFYKAPFGMGQLSLFNVLKAYSILDSELGYCQGLAFICGVLLLHMTEEEAFWLLKFLMFDRQLRLNYLPDMKHFQLQLYQMSRLIKDLLPEVHELFEKNEVATTLFASSWMLTIFSSSFELGFVTRVYDLLLFASNEVIFRVILALLDVHKGELLKLDCFEDIMGYLKNVIPKVDEDRMRQILKRVYELNISRQLLDYKVEYSVLKEELQNTTQHIESLKMAREDIKNLQKQLHTAELNVERLEGIRHAQQQEALSMQLQIQSLEVTIQTLGDFVHSLATSSRTDIDVPADVRRIVQQLEHQQNKQQTKRRPIFLDRKIGKSVSVNSNLGMSLKVLIEQNENDNQTPPCAITPISEGASTSPSACEKKKHFDKAFELVRQARLAESPERPRLIEEEEIKEEEMSCRTQSSHPLVCDDVNFQFNTMQLKTIRSTSAFKKEEKRE